jgi:hypothetical protein
MFDEVDLTSCIDCDFECGTVGYCLNECGESYIVSKLITDKGYYQCNIDTVYMNGEFVRGVEIYKRQAKKFIANMEKLGYNCILHQHPLGKKYLATVIVEGHDPIDLCVDFLKLEVVK